MKKLIIFLFLLQSALAFTPINSNFEATTKRVGVKTLIDNGVNALQVSGSVTANSYYGDGSNLTGISQVGVVTNNYYGRITVNVTDNPIGNVGLNVLATTAVGGIGAFNLGYGVTASGASQNSGGTFVATSTGTNTGVQNIGVYSRASSASVNYGIYSLADSTGTNYGVYSGASGSVIGKNYAGYFDGTVFVRDGLSVGPGLVGSATSNLSVNGITSLTQTNNIVIYTGESPQPNVIPGDIIIRSGSNGIVGSAGSINLFGGDNAVNGIGGNIQLISGKGISTSSVGGIINIIVSDSGRGKQGSDLILRSGSAGLPYTPYGTRGGDIVLDPGKTSIGATYPDRDGVVSINGSVVITGVYSGNGSGITALSSTFVTNNYNNGVTIVGTVTVNKLVDLNGSYAQIIVTYNTLQFVPTNAYATYNVGWINSITKNMTTSTTAGTIVAPISGIYRINYGGSIDKENDGDDIEAGISINGADPSTESEVRLDTTTAGFNTIGGRSVLFRLTAGSIISLKFKNITSNSRYIIMRNANLTVERFGEY